MSAPAHQSPSSQLPLSVSESGQFSFEPDGRWTQGRTLFGGIVAAAGLRALKIFAIANGVDAPIARTVTTTFEKPVAPGPVEGRCYLHHQGKRVCSAEAHFLQDGVVKTRVHVIFGAARETKIRVGAPTATPSPAVETLEPMPYFEGIAPVFTQFVDFRWAKGPLPFSGGTDASFQGYCRWNETGDCREEETLALLDAWPAPVLSLADGPIPASSIIWTAHLYPSLHDVTPGAAFWMQADTLNADDGYATSISHLHDATGNLVAFGEQLVAYFD